jgi:16S rRNA (guanine527-N7)-methyltransferase
MGDQFTLEGAELASLLRPYAGLRSELLVQTSRYIEILLKWNSKVNLTAVRDPKEIATRHFGESYFAGERLFPQPRRATVIDVGSGAGFPGLPLAMLRSETEVTLIEADGKKAAFLNEVIRGLGLKNAKVFGHRAETYQSKAELVTMRAVERFGKMLPVALGLVAGGGRIALMIGASQLAQAKCLAGAVEWEPPDVVPGGRARLLLAGIKRGEEPKG